MDEIQTIQAIASLIGDVGIIGLLLWMVTTERAENREWKSLIITDWQRQREKEGQDIQKTP